MDIMQKLINRSKELSEQAKGLGEKARDLTKRSTVLVESARLKYELAKLEKEMENNMAGLGTLFYQQNRKGEGMEEDIQRLLAASQKLEQEIKDLEEQIANLNPGPARCKACARELPEGASYCPYCGSRLVEPVVKEERPAAEQKEDF